MNIRSGLSCLTASVLSFACLSAEALTIPGTADMWLAGMPAGATASSGDIAPQHSPVLVPDFNPGAGSVSFINVAGGVSNAPGCPTACSPLDGGGYWTVLSQNGLAGVTAPINTLMGVFLDDTQPNSSTAPTALNFQTIGLGFSELAPGLKQVFFIGDGLTGSGTGDLQVFTVPTGATRLYLGTMDGYGWYNNSGTIELTVSQVPLPTSAWLFMSSLVGVFGLRRKARA